MVNKKYRLSITPNPQTIPPTPAQVAYVTVDIVTNIISRISPITSPTTNLAHPPVPGTNENKFDPTTQNFYISGTGVIYWPPYLGVPPAGYYVLAGL